MNNWHRGEDWRTESGRVRKVVLVRLKILFSSPGEKKVRSRCLLRLVVEKQLCKDGCKVVAGA